MVDHVSDGEVIFYAEHPGLRFASMRPIARRALHVRIDDEGDCVITDDEVLRLHDALGRWLNRELR